MQQLPEGKVKLKVKVAKIEGLMAHQQKWIVLLGNVYTSGQNDKNIPITKYNDTVFLMEIDHIF